MRVQTPGAAVLANGPVFSRMCKTPSEAVRPGKFGNNRIRMAGFVNQNFHARAWHGVQIVQNVQNKDRRGF
jgi:hypothetical protein